MREPQVGGIGEMASCSPSAARRFMAPRRRQKALILELIQRPRTRLGEGFQRETGLFRGLLLHPSAAGGLDALHRHGHSPAR
jgi:hypothetical protein